MEIHLSTKDILNVIDCSDIYIMINTQNQLISVNAEIFGKIHIIDMKLIQPILSQTNQLKHNPSGFLIEVFHNNQKLYKYRSVYLKNEKNNMLILRTILPSEKTFFNKDIKSFLLIELEKEILENSMISKNSIKNDNKSIVKL